MAALCSQARFSGPYRPERPDAGWQEDADLHEALRRDLGTVRPRAIFAPPPFDYHPDHRAAAALAQVLAGNEATVFYYEVQAPLPCDGAMLLPESPAEAWAARRRVALRSRPSCPQVACRLSSRCRAASRPTRLVICDCCCAALIGDPNDPAILE